MRIYRFPKFVQRIFPSILWSCPEKQNTVFLTFDDGPHEIYTPQILDILDEHNTKATFFLLGEKIKSNREIVQHMQDSGHSIGIHGYQHTSLLLKSKKTIYEQLVGSKDILESLIGERVCLFRPPYGLFNRVVLKQCCQLSMRLVLWSFMVYDFDDLLEENYLLKVVQEKIRPGDIIVLHDGLINSDRTTRILSPLLYHVRNVGLKSSAIEL